MDGIKRGTKEAPEEAVETEIKASVRFKSSPPGITTPKCVIF
jgi:hypothetical protein